MSQARQRPALAARRCRRRCARLAGRPVFAFERELPDEYLREGVQKLLAEARKAARPGPAVGVPPFARRGHDAPSLGHVSAAVAPRLRTRMAARRRRSVPSSSRGTKTTVVKTSCRYFAASSPSGTGSEQYGRGGRRCEELANPRCLAARPRAVLLVRLERGVPLDDQERAFVLAERAVHRVLQVARFATDVLRELRQQFDQLVGAVRPSAQAWTRKRLRASLAPWDRVALRMELTDTDRAFCSGHLVRCEFESLRDYEVDCCGVAPKLLDFLIFLGMISRQCGLIVGKFLNKLSAAGRSLSDLSPASLREHQRLCAPEGQKLRYGLRIYRVSGFVGNIALIDPVSFGHGNSCRSYTQIVRETFANMAEPFPRTRADAGWPVWLQVAFEGCELASHQRCDLSPLVWPATTGAVLSCCRWLNERRAMIVAVGSAQEPGAVARPARWPGRGARGVPSRAAGPARGAWPSECGVGTAGQREDVLAAIVDRRGGPERPCGVR